MLKINPKGKYTVSESEEFLLGKVDNLWCIDRTDDKSGKSLKERANMRIKECSAPSSSTFDEYLELEHHAGLWRSRITSVIVQLG